MKKIIVCLLLSVMVSTMLISPLAFSDYSEESALTFLHELKILDGDDNPENIITRAEITKIAACIDSISATNSNDITIESPDINFGDIKQDDWFYEYVIYAVSNLIIDGYDDGTFKPNNPVTAAEAIKICLCIPHYNYIINTNNSTDELWYTPWINAAIEYGLISENEFNPNEELSRGQAAELVCRAIHMPLVVQVGGYEGEMSDDMVLDVNLEFEICDGQSRAFDSLYNRFLSNR